MCLCYKGALFLNLCNGEERKEGQINSVAENTIILYDVRRANNEPIVVEENAMGLNVRGSSRDCRNNLIFPHTLKAISE